MTPRINIQVKLNRKKDKVMSEALKDGLLEVDEVSLKRSMREYSLLEKAHKETFSKIVESLRSFSEDLKVEEISPTWVILSHKDYKHKIQLEVEGHGANLDVRFLSRKDALDMQFPCSGYTTSTVKITPGNDIFAKERILSSFDLHNKTVNVDDFNSQSKISYNNANWRRVQEEISWSS